MASCTVESIEHAVLSVQCNVLRQNCDCGCQVMSVFTVPHQRSWYISLYYIWDTVLQYNFQVGIAHKIISSRLCFTWQNLSGNDSPAICSGTSFICEHLRSFLNNFLLYGITHFSMNCWKCWKTTKMSVWGKALNSEHHQKLFLWIPLFRWIQI